MRTIFSFVCFLSLLSVKAFKTGDDETRTLTKSDITTSTTSFGLLSADKEDISHLVDRRNVIENRSGYQFCVRSHAFTLKGGGLDFNYYLDQDDPLEQQFSCNLHEIEWRASGSTCWSGKTYTTDKVVLLQHGLFDSSDTWVMSTNGLGFRLAKEGYAVFLGNSRGNKYCEPVDPNDPTVYKFSWDEMAAFDQPYFFEVIRLITTKTQLKYVGHSQGTTQMFAALSAGYIDKSQVSHFAALAPVVNIGDTTSKLLKMFSACHTFVPTALLALNITSPTPLGCIANRVYTWVSAGAQYFFAGYNSALQDDSVVTVMPLHFPSKTSSQDLLHWNQLVRDKRFEAYDEHFFCQTGSLESADCVPFARWANLVFSGSKVPTYNLNAIGSSHPKILLMYGDNDALATPTGVATLITTLTAARANLQSIHSTTYDHGAYVWGRDVNTDVNTPVYKFFEDLDLGLEMISQLEELDSLLDQF